MYLTANLASTRGDTRKYFVRSPFGTAIVTMLANGRNDPKLEAVTKYLVDRTPANTEATLTVVGDGRYRVTFAPL